MTQSRTLAQVVNRVDATETATTTNDVQLARGGNHGRNLIINGDFSVWQRGTSQTSNDYGSDDRWINENTGTTKVASQQTFTLGQTAVAGSPKYYSRTVVTSVAGASNRCRKSQFIENVVTTSGREVTLSFWAKADASKDIASEFTQNFGTGGSPSSFVSAIGVTTHSLTTSWQRFTTTVTLPSITGKTLGTNLNSSSLGLVFWLDAGSSNDARTNTLGQQSGTFEISNVQLEFGDTATDFEYVTPADQLARCQRYFEKSYDVDVAPGTTGTSGTSNYFQTSSTTIAHSVYFSTTKRSTPTVVFYSPDSGATAKVYDGTSDLAVSAAGIVSTTNFLIYGSAVAVDGDEIRSHWTADAEL